MTLWSPLCLAQVLFLLGTLIFAMSLQLDRRGAWNMMGPCLFAFVVMVTMWVRSWDKPALLARPPSPGDWDKRVWDPRRPLILAMFLPLGPSPAQLPRTAGGTHKARA